MNSVLLAQVTAAQVSAQCFVQRLNDAILFPLITLLLAIAFLVFLWGCFEYIRDASSDQGREKGKQHILWATIGMLIMLSAYSILSLAAGTFGIGLPTVQCGQFTAEENRAISTSPTQPTQPTVNSILESNGFGNLGGFTDETPVLPEARTAPSLGQPTMTDTEIEPFNLLNPEPTPGAPIVDTVSPDPRYPVIETWDNGARLIGCNDEFTCIGAINSCEMDHEGVYSGARMGSEYIVCNP